MAKLTFADSIQPSFGIPFPKDRLQMVQGELECILNPEQQAQLSNQEVQDLVTLINDQPEAERKMPMDWMWTIPSWQKVLDLWSTAKCQIVFGGNRSAKTYFASALNMDVMRRIPEAETYSLQTNEERSIKINQNYLHSRLPLHLKEQEKQKGKNFNLAWSQKNGFTGDICILPPQDGFEKGSYCSFKNYSQYHNDSQAFEGLKGHLVHADEEIPYSLFETIFGRLGDYRGRMILTVTTLQGYTPLVSDLMKGAETMETRFCPDIGRELPTLQKCKGWPDTYIHYWWTEDNPFIDSQEIVKSYSNRSANVRLARLYGIPTKSHNNQFPKFSREVNVVPHEEIPFIKDPTMKYTLYMGADPGGGKPWVLCYMGFTKDACYIFKEFPDASYGEWGIPHQNKDGVPLGKKGPAQRPLGYGFKQWADLMDDLEREIGAKPAMRWIDPNFSKQKITKEEGQTDIIEEMAAVGKYFTVAPHDGVDVGITQINALLEYDDTEPLSETNKPKLYISDQCENTIQAFTEYTGVNKAEVFKDFVDPPRYIIVAGSEYLEEDIGESYGGGSY